VAELFCSHRGIVSTASAARLAMDPFDEKRFVLPIEAMVALAINLVVAVLGYYAIMVWGLFRD
jgi:hypothetical protein